MFRTLFNIALIAVGIAVLSVCANADESSAESGRRRAAGGDLILLNTEPPRSSDRPSSAGSKVFERITRRFEDIENAMRLLRRQINQITTSPKHSAAPVIGARSSLTERVGFRPVYSMNRNGSDVKLLFAVPGMLVTAAPELSHDGNYLAVEAKPVTDDNRSAKIFVCAVEGPFKDRVRCLGFGNTPSWSPDDRRIAAMLNPGTSSGERAGIYLMNADGSERKWICRGMYPRWSPDGKYLAAHGRCGQGSSLLLVNVETHKVQPVDIKGMRLRGLSAGWSPDGRRLVFAASDDGKDRLCTVDIREGASSLRVLYTHDDPHTRLVNPPAWSPDGRQIVFGIHEPPGSGEPRRLHMKSHLYSIAADFPSAPAPIEGKKVGLINRAPSWSSDGRRIVFTSER